MAQESPIFGIDLGTTYCCIAYVDEYGRPNVVPNIAGLRTTPSVVQFDGKERIVGQEAKNSSVLNPDTTVDMVKRYMGRSNEYSFKYEQISYTPEEISSFILRKLVQDAEQQTSYKITDVVITCPAYFGIPEREATAKAGEIAGLNVRSIINEPTAAAIAYGINEQTDQTVLVYDLGGGTFDVTIIKIESGNITVVCTDGDHYLGGRDWDEIIVGYLAGEWQKQIGSSEDPLESSETLQDLKEKAEKAKQTLTGRENTAIRIVHDSQSARIDLTREKFDELTDSLLSRTIELTKQAIAEASKRGVHDFDELLMVGGSTRMPQVARRLKAEFNKEPKFSDPDEAVAKGAAIYGQKLMLDDDFVKRLAAAVGSTSERVDIEKVDQKVVEEVQKEIAQEYGLQLPAVKKSLDTKIINVTSRSFGIIVWNPRLDKENVSNMIIRNDTLPASITKTFGTREANQDTVELVIVDNLSSDGEYNVADSRELGKTEINLPSNLPEDSPIEVTFQLDEQGRLKMHARELKEGREVEIELQTESVTSQEEIKAAAARSKSLVVS
jgi:molecular chaperone DnaK